MTTLCQITMNAGQDIPGSVIQWNLKQNAKKFDRVIVVDGHLTDSAKLFYTQFSNVEVVDFPWEDSYVKQYEAWKSKLKEGEWALYLDCDEIPSNELLNFIKGDFCAKNKTLWSLPCILHITEDGKKYYPVEQEPLKYYDGQFVKHILLEKNDKLWFKHFGSHVEPQTEKGSNLYFPLPYYHLKSLESFVYNDVWQAFLHPQGQQYTEIESAQFKLLTSVYKNSLDFKKATQKGEWLPPLIKFAWDKRWVTDRPISRLAWVYFLLEGHETPEDDARFTWENVKEHILGEEAMNLLQKNKQEGNYIDVSDL